MFEVIKNDKGLTVVELLLALSLGAIFITIAYSMMAFGSQTFNRSINEYSLQADFRVAAESLNNYTRYSTVLFGVTADRFDPDDLTPGWDYVGVSVDGAEIIHYQYNIVTSEHVPVVIVESNPGITYAVEFNKKDPDAEDKLLSFKLQAFRDGVPVGIVTELDALNSLQVVDQGHPGNPAVALAFRSDRRPTPESAQAAIVMVLDESGSMGDNLAGGSSPAPFRINILKETAINMVNDLESASVSIVGFDTNANNPSVFFNVDTQKDNLNTRINQLTAGGGTNTGDGLRRGYHQLLNYPTRLDTYHPDVAGKDILYYMIVLVDGVTTFGTFDIYRSGSNYYYDNLKVDEGNVQNNYSIYTFSGSYSGSGGTLIQQARPSGRGNVLCPAGSHYVNHIGTDITDPHNGLNITTFVIGFTAVPAELGSCGAIAAAINAKNTGDPDKDYYVAADEEELQNIFDEIGQLIMSDLWHISGP